MGSQKKRTGERGTGRRMRGPVLAAAGIAIAAAGFYGAVFQEKDAGEPHLYFENVDVRSTQTDRENALQLNLQERLAAVIEEYDNVQEACVYIHSEKDGGETADSAAVMLKTCSGPLSDEAAAAIRQTVSQAVEGLETEDVTMMDQDGYAYDQAAPQL